MRISDDIPDDDSRDEGPGEFDRHLTDDDPSQTVPCAHCGKSIWAYAQRCPHCRTHFMGEAWQFVPQWRKARRRSLWWWCALTAALLTLLLWLMR